MEKKRVTAEDQVAIGDCLGRYCWHADEGDVQKWLALWTEDGVFALAGMPPMVGYEALKYVPVSVAAGKMRHSYSNLHCDYGATDDTIIARYYNLVTSWENGGAFKSMIIGELTCVRDGNAWKIKRNDVRAIR
jgi:hypothetical protein